MNNSNLLQKRIFNNLQKLLLSSDSRVTLISPLYGSLKSFSIKVLFNKNEQLVLLLAESKLVNEIKVELNILGLADYLIVIDDFNIESIQEKITEISKRKKFVLVTTYNILNLKANLFFLSLTAQIHLKKQLLLLRIRV